MDFTKISENQLKFNFIIKYDEFEKIKFEKFENIKKNKKNIVKGFRNQNIPLNVYEQKYGAFSLVSEVIQHILEKKFNSIVSSGKFHIVSYPSDLKFDEKKILNKEDFSLSFVLALKPEIKLNNYKNISLPALKNNKITDQEIEKEINNLLEENKEKKITERTKLQKNDIAVFDFEGFIDNKPFKNGSAKNFELKIGSKQFIDNFEEQMIGMNKNEEKEIEVSFPKDYFEKKLANKKAKFIVKLLNIKEEKRPVLTEKFVISLKNDNYRNITELKEYFRNKLQEEKERQHKQKTIDILLENLRKINNFVLPSQMIDEEKKTYKKSFINQAQKYNLTLEQYLNFSHLTLEQFEEEAKKEAIKRISNSLIIEQIAKIEKINITPDELKQYYETLSKKYHFSVEEIKQKIDSKIVINDLLFEKTIAFLMKNATFN